MAGREPRATYADAVTTVRPAPALRLGRRLPSFAGLATSLGCVTATTLLVGLLKERAPVESLGVAYVPAVLLVATFWGGPLGYATALISAAALNWFHLPPTGRFELLESENWVALAVFVVVAFVAGSLARHAKARTEEAEQRRLEADLAAELARHLLRGGGRLEEALPLVSRRLADALGAPFATITREDVGSDGERTALPLQEGDRRIGTLVLPASTPRDLRARIEQIVPSLEALLAAALERDALLADVVETAALRRSDDLKTALLRAVSHDLRTPLTAILTAEEALRSSQLTAGEHGELVDDIGTEARRLSILVDKLLDLGRLEAEGATPRAILCSLPEVVDAAIRQLGLPAGTFRVGLDADLPEVLADARQLERAFGNLLENAARYSGGHAVSIRGRRVGERVIVRIVDRGPGLPGAASERVFEPFYRGAGQPAGARGSGLGLAIVRGFVEANGGRVWAESVPEQGTTFVVEFPVPSAAAAPPTLAVRAGRA